MIKGHVIRPDYGIGDSNVVLTATIKKGTVTKTMTFNASVKESGMTDTQSTTADKNWLDIANKTAIKNSITLPSVGPNGSNITWVSSAEVTITDGGVVTRPANLSPNITLNLTATITKGLVTTTKIIAVTVVAWTDAEDVSIAIAALTWDDIRGNNDLKTNITSDLTLSATGLNGTSIVWSPTVPTVITSAGIITRPIFAQGDVTFSLPCTVTKGTVTTPVQNFLGLKVVKLPISNAEAVNKSLTLVDATMIKGTNADLSDMTTNVVLPQGFDLVAYPELKSVTLLWSLCKSKLDQTADTTNAFAKTTSDVNGVQTLVITRPVTGQPVGTAFLQVKAMSSTATGDTVSTYNVFPLTILVQS